jgi:hypothetical protein
MGKAGDTKNAPAHVAVDRFGESVKRLADQYTGTDLNNKIREMAAGFDAAQKSTGIHASDVDKLVKQIYAFSAAGGNVPARLTRVGRQRTTTVALSAAGDGRDNSRIERGDLRLDYE